MKIQKWCDQWLERKGLHRGAYDELARRVTVLRKEETHSNVIARAATGKRRLGLHLALLLERATQRAIRAEHCPLTAEDSRTLKMVRERETWGNRRRAA